MPLEEREESFGLLLVDLKDCPEDLQVFAVRSRPPGDEGPDILREAGTAEPYPPRPKECRAYPAVHPYHRKDLT